MARITGEEDAHVLVEMICETLTDAVCGPPERFLEVHCIRCEDCFGLGLQVFEFDVFGGGAGGQLDVEAHEAAAFAGDDQKVAGRGVDCAFAPDVGEGGVGVDVHYAPDSVGGVAEHVVGQRAADC